MDIRQKKFSWEDISIAEYYKLLKINDLAIEDREPKLVALLCDVDEDDINKMDFSDFNELRSKINTKWLKNLDVDEKKIKSIKLKNVKLVGVYSLYNFSVAQFFDMSNYSENKDTTIEQMISCLFIPEGKEYGECYDIEELQKSIRDELDIYTGLGIVNFFIGSMTKSLKNILDYLQSRTLIKNDKTMEKLDKKILDTLS